MRDFPLSSRSGHSETDTLAWTSIVASSDARNIQTAIRQEGNEIVISGHKWVRASRLTFVLSRLPAASRRLLIPPARRHPPSASRQWISGAGDPRCAFHLLMGVSDGGNPDPYKRQSIVLIPTDAKGLRVVRPMTVMGYDDAPEGQSSSLAGSGRVTTDPAACISAGHCEVVYDNVRVPLANLIGGWGRGFEVRPSSWSFV